MPYLPQRRFRPVGNYNPSTPIPSAAIASGGGTQNQWDTWLEEMLGGDDPVGSIWPTPAPAPSPIQYGNPPRDQGLEYLEALGSGEPGAIGPVPSRRQGGGRRQRRWHRSIADPWDKLDSRSTRSGLRFPSAAVDIRRRIQIVSSRDDDRACGGPGAFAPAHKVVCSRIKSRRCQVCFTSFGVVRPARYRSRRSRAC